MSFIQLEINWLIEVIRFRATYPNISLGYFPREVTLFHKSEGETVLSAAFWESVSPPSPAGSASAYSRFILENKLNFADRLLLALTIAPQILPEFMEAELLRMADNPFSILQNEKESFTGLIQSSITKVYLPTALTYVYLQAGNDFIHRYKYSFTILHKESILFKDNLIALCDTHPAEPLLGGLLMIRKDFLLNLLDVPEDASNPEENQTRHDLTANS